jgi:hypothetical protein
MPNQRSKHSKDGSDVAAAKITSATTNARKAQNSCNFRNAVAMVANAANKDLIPVWAIMD